MQYITQLTAFEAGMLLSTPKTIVIHITQRSILEMIWYSTNDAQSCVRLLCNNTRLSSM